VVLGLVVWDPVVLWPEPILLGLLLPGLVVCVLLPLELPPYPPCAAAASDSNNVTVIINIKLVILLRMLFSSCLTAILSGML